MSVARLAAAGILAWTVAVLSIPVLIPAAALEARLMTDLQALRQTFGDQAPDRVRSFAARLRGLEPARDLAEPPSRPWVARPAKFLPGSVAAQAATALHDRWRRGLQRQSELAAVRLGIMLVWLLALWPLLVAAAYDGWMQRRLRQARTGAARPTAFTIAGLVVICLASIPVVFVTLPLPWPQGWAPAWALATGMALAIRVALGRPWVFR